MTMTKWSKIICKTTKQSSCGSDPDCPGWLTATGTELNWLLALRKR